MGSRPTSIQSPQVMTRNERITTDDWPGFSSQDPRAEPTPLRSALRPFRTRFAWAAIYFALVFLFGSIGFYVIEDWTWFEAVYMSVTTVTSVGFMEVRPLSPAGRTFTMILIALGITGLGIWWALTTALIVELDLAGVMRRRRMTRRIETLADHFIVCGTGRMGRVVVREMTTTSTPFVVIEKDDERAEELLEAYPDALVIEGDATKEHILETARVESARGLASCLADDADNVLVCLTARGLNPQLTLVARAYSEESFEKLRRAGADHVIAPTVTSGIRMASTLLRPQVVSFLDVATTGADIELRLEEAEITPESRLVGKSLADARIPQRTGLIVLALRRAGGDGKQRYNPGPETTLEAGDVMIVLGRPEQVQQLRNYVRDQA